MSYPRKSVSEFSLEGRFLGFVYEGCKIKRLKLLTAEGEYSIKVAKPLRSTLDPYLKPGTWVSIAGEKKIKLDSGTYKLKAYYLQPAHPNSPQPSPSLSVKPATPPKATILVCQKSDCCKRGGKEVCQALQKTLQERALDNHVTIKGTGCLKQCKAGPNIVIMPDKTRYSRIDASEIPAVIDKHFPVVGCVSF